MQWGHTGCAISGWLARPVPLCVITPGMSHVHCCLVNVSCRTNALMKASPGQSRGHWWSGFLASAFSFLIATLIRACRPIGCAQDAPPFPLTSFLTCYQLRSCTVPTAVPCLSHYGGLRGKGGGKNEFTNKETRVSLPCTVETNKTI